MKMDIFSLMIICGLILFVGSYALGPALSIIDSGSEVKVTLGEESKGYITSATTLSTLGTVLTEQGYSDLQKSDQKRFTYRSESGTPISKNWPILQCDFNFGQVDFGMAQSIEFRAEGFSLRTNGDMPGAELQMYIWNLQEGKWVKLGNTSTHNKTEDAVITTWLTASEIPEYLDEDMIIRVAIRGQQATYAMGPSPIYYPSYMHLDQVYAIARYYEEVPTPTPTPVPEAPYSNYMLYAGAALIGCGVALALKRRRAA